VGRQGILWATALVIGRAQPALAYPIFFSSSSPVGSVSASTLLGPVGSGLVHGDLTLDLAPHPWTSLSVSASAPGASPFFVAPLVWAWGSLTGLTFALEGGPVATTPLGISAPHGIYDFAWRGAVDLHGFTLSILSGTFQAMGSSVDLAPLEIVVPLTASTPALIELLGKNGVEYLDGAFSIDDIASVTIPGSSLGIPIDLELDFALTDARFSCMDCATVPEPGSAVGIGTGLVLLALRRRAG